MLESIYEEAICYEFELRKIAFQRQFEVDVICKGRIIKGQRIDLLVENAVILEIKSLSKLPEVATAQILSYLKVIGMKRGLLLNFGAVRLIEGIKRISL